MPGTRWGMTTTKFESQLMDALDVPAEPAALTPRIRTRRSPRIWKFWGTGLWGLFVFAAMFVGQIAVVAWFVLRRDGAFGFSFAVHVVGRGLAVLLLGVFGPAGGVPPPWVAVPPAGPFFSAF